MYKKKSYVYCLDENPKSSASKIKWKMLSIVEKMFYALLHLVCLQKLEITNLSSIQSANNCVIYSIIKNTIMWLYVTIHAAWAPLLNEIFHFYINRTIAQSPLVNVPCATITEYVISMKRKENKLLAYCFLFSINFL